MIRNKPALGLDPRVETGFPKRSCPIEISSASICGDRCSRVRHRRRRHPTGRGAERPPVRRLVVLLATIAVVLVLVPYAIAPFYRFIDPVSMPMLWRFATGARVERIIVPLSRIAPTLRLAVIVAEDGSFCRNPGIDLG